jgi:hypothetical protein
MDTIDDAADAFLNRWADAEVPSEKKEEEASAEVEDDTTESDETEDATDTDATEQDAEEQPEDETDTESDESTDDTQEDPEDDESNKGKPTPKALGDDDEVEITIDKEKRKVPVKELKRLYGQEAALTKKSQQVATQRKEVEAQGVKHAAVLDQLFQRAQAKWEPYSKVDMLLASKELDTEDFAALRAEAQAAYDEFQFVSQEADQFMANAQARHKEGIKQKAQDAVKVLKELIPNWSNELYDKLRTYAVDNGFDPEITAQITDPSAIQMLYKARLYDEGKKIKLKPKAKVPTKVIKSSTTTALDVTPQKSKAAMLKLQQSGSVDDAVEAMMARWGN